MIKKLFNKIIGNTVSSMSFQQAMDLLGLPVITLYQGGKKFNFILDTGSTHNIINKSVLPEMNYYICEDVKSNLSGIECNKKQVDMCAINLTYKDKEYPSTYLIGDLDDTFADMKKESGVNLHGLLGSSFFNQYRYVIDFNELIAYSKA